MILKLNMSSDIPIYVQLRNQIVLGIGRGELKIGQGLPTVRQLASDVGVNTMTVNKAYQILKTEGFIEIDRRHGAKVSELIASDASYQEKMQEELALLVTESSIKGISKEDFIRHCSDLFDHMRITSLEGEMLC